jgi:hypothetical protein
MNKNRPPYSLGWLGIFPLVGFFVGIALVLYGIFKYKDKKLIIIGSAGILFSVIVYTSLFIYMTGISGRKGFASIAQQHLNTLTRTLEFYKLEYGSYPDSLQQLKVDYSFAPINDPVAPWNAKNTLFNYRTMGDRYLLFSSGVDRKENTEDDIYPTIKPSDTSRIKFNYIKYEPH